MNHNPYQAPRANLYGLDNPQLAPALWNPNAAANWCLLFSPVFGAWLHMKNWQAMGQHDKAQTARVWLILSILVMTVLVFGGMFVPLLDLLGRVTAFILLLTWYFAAAKGQMRYVAQNFGQSYPRKGWFKPLGFGVLAIFFGAIATGVIAVMAR